LAEQSFKYLLLPF